ncbi:MAG TPA: hypothetical protein VG603_08585, partial [Chitinophagales bacterium]|nr:hypothetical protein [Chitinophagales bacterium]
KAHPEKEERDAIASYESAEYNTLAWRQLFAKDYDGAVNACFAGRKIDPHNDVIYTNLALAYLFKGDYKKAEGVYLNYRNKNYYYSDKPFKKGFLEDLKTFEDAGYIKANDPEIVKIKQLLK